VEDFTAFNLDSNICKAITLRGYTKPTPVQAKSIPEIMIGRDVVVSAPTGSGKTAAFVLPTLHNLSVQQPSKKTRVLILTPTRELASQITKAADLYGKFMRFNIVSLVGGMPYHNQIKDLARGADIIVATPGRLMDHMEQKRIDLSSVEMLVLDEADRMLDMGFIDDVQYIAKLTPSKRQTLLFSATLDNKLMNVVKHLLKNPVRIDLSNEKISAPKIQQEVIKANNAHHKTRMLKHFLNDENIFKAIIFSATKINADRLANDLRDQGFAAAALHGDLRQNVRNRTLEQLRHGKVQYLVATDVAARGIDVSDISHVFNYDLPRFSEDYVHRIGRTGRAGKTGIAISFVLPTEMHLLKSIERYTGQRIQVTQLNELNNDSPSVKKPHQDREIFSSKQEFSSTSERPPRKQRSDRPERSFKSERSERPERSFKSERSERPERKFKSDRSERPERKFKSDRSERPERKFKSDRSERPERSFKSDRSERPERSFKSDRSERPERKFKSDRSERPERSFKSDRSERPERSFKSDRSENPVRSFKSARSDQPVRVEFKEGYRSKSKMPSSKNALRDRDEKRRTKSADDYKPHRDKNARTENRPFKKTSGSICG